jgi:DNA-binding GntR family transcriptional regulator
METAPPTEADGPRGRFERMYGEIRMRIMLLDYPPGTRLSEVALAREFGVSRTPLRRVLGRLETEGLLVSVHGVGTIVTDVEIDELAQVFRLRLELAELTGRLDPQPPTPDLMAAFHRFADRSRELQRAPDPRAFAQLNLDFFLAHLQLTASEPLREICERLYYRTARIWLKSVGASRIDLSEEVAIFDREVQDMIAAVALGDMEAAALVHRAHISMSFARMRRNAAG